MKTNTANYTKMVGRLAKQLGREKNLIHAALGATSETGELADQIKAHIVYHRPLDVLNLIEEGGDAIFFITWAAMQYGFTLDDILAANQAKLNARYAEGYSDAAANNRKRLFEREQMAKALGLPLSAFDHDAD